MADTATVSGRASGTTPGDTSGGLATPRASRLQRPGWRDGRLVVGVLVVLLSVVIGAKVVASADDTTPVYAAARALVPGQVLTTADLTRVDVRIDGGEGPYLRADQDLAPGSFALREVRAGELLPATAVGDKADVTVRPVTVPADATSVSRLTTGSVVDVWVNPKMDSVGADTFGKPNRLLESASVAGLPEEGGARFGSSGTTGVQLMVPDERVQDLIAAIDQGARVTLVPVPGSPLQDG